MDPSRWGWTAWATILGGVGVVVAYLAWQYPRPPVDPTPMTSAAPQASTSSAPETPFEACPDGSVCVWEGYYFTGGFKAYGVSDLNYAGDRFSDGIAVNDHVSSYYNNTDQWVNFYLDAGTPVGDPCVREQPRGYRADLRVEGCDNNLSAHSPDGGG